MIYDDLELHKIMIIIKKNRGMNKKYSRNNDIWWDAALQPYGENIT